MDWIKKHWYLIIFAAAVIGETAVAEYRLAEAETNIEKLEEKIEAQAETKEQLIRIEEQNKYTKERMEEMRRDIKLLIREIKDGSN